jgi:hypothetical protein
MSTELRLISLPMLLLALGGRSLTAQHPDTLTPADLSVRGLDEETDTASARRVLGPPLRVVQHEAPNDDGVRLLEWHYHEFTVRFAVRWDGPRRYAVDLTGPSVATTRRVRVGDPESKVTQAYGTPLHRDTGYLLYAASTSDFETRGITFFLANGRVTRIKVGHVISVE